MAAIHLRIHLGTHIRLDRLDIPTLAVVECLAAALLYAVSSVLQQRAAREQPPDLSLRPGLLLALVRSPWWMLGMLADIGGFALQFLALRIAALALVTPLLVVGLVFSVVGAAWAEHRRANRREWNAACLVVAGLVLFLLVAQPGPGHPKASATGWWLLAIISTAAAGGCVLFAGDSPRRRALLLGTGTGIIYGVTMAITEHTGHLLDRGIIHALSSWSPYVLVVASITGLLINQSAFQAGDLRWSLPAITVVEPLVAIAIGQVLFGEFISTTPLALVGEFTGLACVTAGVVRLTADRTNVRFPEPERLS